MSLPSADGSHPALHEAYEVWGASATVVGPVAVLEVDARPLAAPDGEPILISEVDGEHDVHGCWGAEPLAEDGRRLTFVTGAEVTSARLWLWCEDAKAVEVPAPLLQMAAEAVQTWDQPLEIPNQALDTPAQALDTPAQAIDTPAQAFDTPAPADGPGFESIFDREDLETGAFEPAGSYERGPGIWPAGSFAASDLRHLRDHVQRQHLPALVALAAAFVALLVIALTGVGPTAF